MFKLIIIWCPEIKGFSYDNVLKKVKMYVIMIASHKNINIFFYKSIYLIFI